MSQKKKTKSPAKNKTPRPTKLLEKERRFCLEYMQDPTNQSKAAIKAGYSAKTAYAQASRLLKKVKIREEINRLREKLEDKAILTVDRILQEISRVALIDPATMFNKDTGELLPLSEMPEDTRRAVASLEVDDLYEFDDEDGKKKRVGNLHKIKLWDKVKGLELAGRHFKMFTDKLEIDDSVQLAERLQGARERSGLAKKQK